MNQKGSQILDELQSIIVQIKAENVYQLIELINQSNHIFLAGFGRSGLMIKAFSNRLLHLGYQISVIGELSTPHTKPGDLLIIGSGSGNSIAVKTFIETAKKNQVNVALITANKQIEKANGVDCVIYIPANSKEDSTIKLQPMGSLFEQASLILYDSIVLMLMEEKRETNQTMKSRHADLE